MFLRAVKYMAILGACLLATSLVASQFEAGADGAGMRASFIAALVVWLPFSAALLMTSVAASNVANPFAVIQATLLGTVVRTAVPFGFGLWASRQEGALAEANVFGLIVVHYFVAWAVETPLTLRLISQSKAKSGVGNVVSAG